MVCFFTPNNSFWHTLISGLLEAMFDMLFVLPVLPLFPGILLSPFRRQLTQRGDEKTPSSYYCDSISHGQCHQAATAGLLNKLEDQMGAEGAHNTGSSTLPDQSTVLLHLNTPGPVVLQYKGCWQFQTRHRDKSGSGSIQWVQTGDEAKGRTRDKDTARSIHRTGHHSSGRSSCLGLSLNRGLGAFGIPADCWSAPLRPISDTCPLWHCLGLDSHRF